MTTNERRLQALNQMRASYRGEQLLRQDRIKLIQHGTVVQSHEISINDSDHTRCDDLAIEIDECDMLKKLLRLCMQLQVIQFGWVFK